MKLSQTKPWAWVLAVALLGGQGCKGESEDGGGASFSACGGDVSGTWQLQSADFNESLFDASSDELPEACGGMPDSVTGTGQNARMTFQDGVATSEGSVSMSIDFRYTPECVEAVTDGALEEATADFCEQVGASIDESIKEDDPNSSGSCRLESGGCACTISMTQDISSVDSYSQAGNTLIIDDVEVKYCVSGNDLTLEDEYATTRLIR